MELSEDELLELEKFDVKDQHETTSKSEKTIYDKSLNIIKESMSDVLQEMVIIIDDIPHLVYIQSFNIDNGKIEFSFSTLSDVPKEQLVPHIENCFKTQIKQFKTKSWFQRLF